MERDDAWSRLFDRMPIMEGIRKEGAFFVSAGDMKEHGGREPRLMAKIDTLAERPAALAEHGLAIFPVRNGRYALFPDPEGKSFYRIAEKDVPIARPFRSAVDLDRFDTYPHGREASESQALDFAYLSSLLPAFCGDEGMRLTLRGRLFSGDFGFRTPVDGIPLGVSRVQIEVDAGYEGDQGIYLVEAKQGRRDDFHIRQLWYPYLNWAARTRKRVVPVFFAYSNGLYFLTEFSFGKEFGEMSVVKSRAYCLEDPKARLDFRSLLKSVRPGEEPEGAFPQANDLDKVVDTVLAAQTESGGDSGAAGITKMGIAERFDIDERQGDYYGNAGRYLGLLSRDGGIFQPTESGREFNALRSRSARTAVLARRMLEIPSLRQAVELLVARDFRVEKIFPAELAAVVRDNTALSASTPARRASTVKSWLTWITRNVDIRVS